MARRRPTPGTKGKNVGPWEGVLAKAMALSPGERWKTAGELLTALEATVEAATSAASESPRPSAVTSRPTLVMATSAAARGFAPDQAPTERRVDSLAAAPGRPSDPAPGAGAQSGEPAGDGTSQSPERVSIGWRRSIVGGVAAMLIVAALVVARVSLRRKTSESPIPTTIGESRGARTASVTLTPERIPLQVESPERPPSLLSASVSVTKVEEAKPAGPGRVAAAIEQPAATVVPSIQPSRQGAIDRAAAGNPRSVIARKAPATTDARARTSGQATPRTAVATPNLTQTPTRSTERLPIE